MTEHLIIKSQGRLPSEYEIINFEKEIGIRLPESYRIFLLNTNARYISETNFQANETTYEIHGFTTFGDGEWTLEDHYRNLKEHFENRFIAFAHDSGGWQYVISIEQNENYGKIYFCRMDEEIKKATILIANSFKEFIGGIHLNPNS